MQVAEAAYSTRSFQIVVLRGLIGPTRETIPSRRWPLEDRINRLTGWVVARLVCTSRALGRKIVKGDEWFLLTGLDRVQKWTANLTEGGLGHLGGLRGLPCFVRGSLDHAAVRKRR